MLSTKKILTRTIQVGVPTLLSRFFGVFREILMVRYLGASGLSDVFLTAYRLPNSLRKVFAEGALSAAFIPTIVTIIKQEQQRTISGIMSIGFIIFEGTVLILCGLIMFYAHNVIHFIAPGFTHEQLLLAIPMVHILMPMIFFISSSALLAGALHAINHFFVPAFSPIMMNFIFIIGILVCLYFSLQVTVLCWFILAAGIAHFIAHIIQYRRLQFGLTMPTKHDFIIFAHVLGKFILCLPSVSLMEIALLINNRFASRLAPGSISLFSYANRFFCIPLGVFAVAFSTILLPHFSRIHTYSPRRLHFYLLESAKFIFWITTPVALLMSFFAHDIFLTIFVSQKFTIAQAYETGNLLIIFLAGLFFFSLNKIILNIFYSMHATWVPALSALITTTVNVLLNMLLVGPFQTMGLACAIVAANALQTTLFLTILYKKYTFRIYLYTFFTFVKNYVFQLTVFSGLFLVAYYAIQHMILWYMTPACAAFFLTKIGLWFWIAPLAGIFFILIWYVRRSFGIHIHFLE